MNKFMLICFAALVLLVSIAPVTFAAEPAAQTQTTVSDYTTRDLTAYLKRSTAVEITPDSRGFIQRWLLLEPIRQTSLRSNSQLTDSFVQKSIKAEYFPNQFTVVPRNGDKVTVNNDELTWHAIDSGKYDVNLFCFAKAVDKPTYNVLFWAVTIINCPQDIPGVRLSVGSNSASIWWVNDKEVIAIYGDRHHMIDDGISKRVTLKKGTNIVRGAVINAPGLSAFCARFIDSEDKPVTKGFTISVGDIKK